MPGTGKVDDYRDKVDEFVVILTNVRHPAAKDAVAVPGFQWEQEEDAHDVTPSSVGGAGRDAADDSTQRAGSVRDLDGDVAHGAADTTAGAPSPPDLSAKDHSLDDLTIPELQARCRDLQQRMEPNAWLDMCKQHFGTDREGKVRMPASCAVPVRLMVFIEECQEES